MTLMERAVAHGYLRATLKDYWSKRERAVTGERPRSGRNDLAKLQADMARLSGGIVSGPSPDGPVH